MRDAEMRVDGNAIAGVLGELLAPEPTEVRVRCAACGELAELGAEPVYVRAAGAVVRCRRCDAAVLVVVRGRGRAWIGLAGASLLELHGL